MSWAAVSSMRGRSATAASAGCRCLASDSGRQVVRRDGIFNTKSTDGRSLECRHHGGRAERRGQVAAERPDVRAAAAFDVEFQLRVFVAPHLQAVNRHGPRGNFDRPPLPASLYARRPAIFTAEWSGGRCWMSPRNCGSAASIVARSAAVRPSSGVTSPSMSSVSLRRPSRNVARYAFGIRWTYWMSRVACPTQITRTPVASGSSVPACPARVGRTSRSTRSTTSRDVQFGRLVHVENSEVGHDM